MGTLFKKYLKICIFSIIKNRLFSNIFWKMFPKYLKKFFFGIFRLRLQFCTRGKNFIMIALKMTLMLVLANLFRGAFKIKYWKKLRVLTEPPLTPPSGCFWHLPMEAIFTLLGRKETNFKILEKVKTFD